MPFCYLARSHIGLLQPLSNASITKVWAVPISLAATDGISFDFSSSPYLDVSVRVVSSTCFNVSAEAESLEHEYTAVKRCGFPHSDIAGSKAFGASPTRIARLMRPSSVPCTKASTVCVNKDFITIIATSFLSSDFKVQIKVN